MLKKLVVLLFGLIVLPVLIFVIWPDKPYIPHQVSPEYQAQLDTFDIPDMPDDWTWLYVETEDGARLRYGVGEITPNAKATLIFIPGFTDTLSQYGEHFTYWQNAGYTVIGLDLRGQGGSSRPFPAHPERPWVDDFGIYADDLTGFLDMLHTDQSRPYILIGASFGGHVSFRAASERSQNIDGMVLLAPVFRPNTAPYSYKLSKTITGTLNRLGKSKRYGVGQHDWRPDTDDMSLPIACSSAPKRVYVRDAVYARDISQRMGTATNGWLAAMMASGEAMQEPDAIARVKLPVSMVLADNDMIIVNSHSEAVCAQLENCKLMVLKNAGHCIPQERDEIVAAMYRAVDDMVARAKK